MSVWLPRCDKCDKEFEKLLQCGRCKNAFYCSRECQNSAWKNHKNMCRRPGQEPPEAARQLISPAAAPTKKEVADTERAAGVAADTELSAADSKPSPFKKEAPTRVTKEELESEDVAESAKQFRQELLRETQATNAKMVAAMQDSRGYPEKFLPQVLELKEDYEKLIFERLSARSRAESYTDEDKDQFPAAVKLGQELMREVIMAILQRGVSRSASVDQIDLANNHFNAGILQQRPPSDFALEEDALDGFEPAVTKVKEKGFVTVEGLLDDEIASVIHKECKDRFWDLREKGAMHPARGAADGAYECWVPYPPRKGTSPELEHALRILFGLPREMSRHGYQHQLKVPTMAHLACFPPGDGRERLHLDHDASKTGESSGGRELTIVLFLTPGLTGEDHGAFRAYFDENDCPGTCPQRSSDSMSVPEQSGSNQEMAETGGGYPVPDATVGRPEATEPFKDILPEAGRCLIFRSRELWHEVLPARKMHFALTLFVQRAD